MTIRIHRVLLTGASGGIGLATAVALAASGVAIHAVVRTQRSADVVRRAVLEVAPHADITFHLADLAALDDVRTLVATLEATERPLDALILNAAAPPPRTRELTDDGFERQLAVGHLAHFALAAGLMPSLARRPGFRVVVVASQVAYEATLDLGGVDALSGRPQSAEREGDITGTGYHPARTYAAVKLANVLFTVGLSRRLRPFGGTAVCLHPGVVRSALLDALLADPHRSASPIARVVAPARAVGRAVRRLRPAREEARWWDTPEEAAARVVAALTSPALRALSGVFLHDGAERPLPDLACDEAAVERLWQASERLTAKPSATRT
jgi:NAD(P)-dependent dehydrogenase (short-subunit alcohol dehydrogenase family)